MTFIPVLCRFSALENKEAKQHLSEAMRLANMRGMDVQARSVRERLFLIGSQDLQQLDSFSNERLRRIVMDLTMEELKRVTSTYVEATISEKELAQTFLISFKMDAMGPAIHGGENVDLEDFCRLFALNKIVLPDWDKVPAETDFETVLLIPDTPFTFNRSSSIIAATGGGYEYFQVPADRPALR